MMQKFIGNIICNKNYKIASCFKKYSSLSDIDNDLPTMVIGLDNAKEYIGQEFSIIKKKYKNGMLWWTFSKTERRVDHDNDMKIFKNFCINNVVSNIKYKYINILDIDTFGKIRKAIKFVKNSKEKLYYIDNNKFVFLYDVENNNGYKNIYGFSLTTCEFYGISKNKVISLIESNNKNKKIDNFYKIPNDIKKIINNDIPNEIVLIDYF